VEDAVHVFEQGGELARREVQLDQFEPRSLAQSGEVGELGSPRIVVGEAVDPYNCVTLVDKRL